MSCSPSWVRFTLLVLCTMGTGLTTYLWSRITPALYRLGDMMATVRVSTVPWRDDLTFATMGVALTALTTLTISFVLLGKASLQTLVKDLSR